MRYSEAVKRYKFETKQRILSNILEAAEKEQTAARLSDNNETENGTNETNKKETIIMKETFFNEVSRRKSGAIAAACAALIIGGSVAAFANSNKLQKDNSSVAVTNSNPGASTVLNSGRPDENSTSTDADETASQDENPVNDAVTPEVDSAEASSADDTSSKNNKKNDSSASANDTTSKNTTVTPNNNTTSSTTDNKKTAAADPDVKASFDELLASTDYVMLGQIVKAEPTTITNRDGSTQYCIAYEIYHEYNYVKNTKQLYFIGEWDTTIYQPVAEGTKPSLVYGDQAVFMAYDSGNYGMVKTASNGVFAPGKNDLKSVSSGTDSINNAMTDYIFNTVLHGRDRYNVEGWISSLYGNDSYDWADDIYDENYPFEATFVSWDGSKFILHENTNPTWQAICQKLADNDGYCYNYETDYPVYTDDPINHDEPIFVSDCDELDIAMTGISLNTKTNAIAFDFSIMPKAGSRIILNDGVFYDLKVNSNKILGDMGKYFNADSIIVSKAQKFSLFPDNCICFTVMLYQSEPNGKLSLDLDRNFSFTLGGIYNADGSALYNSEIKIDFKVDSRVLAEVGDDEVNILPSETADRKILG